MFGLSTGIIYSMYSSIFITGEYSQTINSSNFYSEMTFNNSIIIAFCCFLSLCYGLKKHKSKERMKNLNSHVFINYKLIYLFVPFVIIGIKVGFLIGLYSNYQSNTYLNVVILCILLIISTTFLYKR